MQIKIRKFKVGDERGIQNFMNKALKVNDVSFFPCEKALDWDWKLVEKGKF